ncbi:MAG: HD domain-containing phosphohydrolase [Pseudomonadota bacterium]
MTDTVKDLRAKLDEAQRTIAELLDLTDRHRSKPTQREQELEDSRSAHLFMLEDLEQSRLKIELAHQEWMAALDAIDDPVFVHDKEFKILRANRAYQQRASRPFQEIIGQPYFDVFPKAPGPLPGCQQAKERGEDGEEEEVIADGRTYRSRAFPVHDQQGVYLYSVHSMEDITERKLTDHNLRESERRYRNLFETMLNGFAYCRMLYEDGKPVDFIYLDVNAAFEKQTGLQNVEGRRVSEVIPGIRESDPKLFDIYGRVAAGGAPEQFEIHVDALKMWFFISVYCPQPEHFVAVFDVITERKQAEQALKREVIRHRLLMESSRDGIAVINQQHEIVEVNSCFARMLGYESEEMIGMHTWDFEVLMSEQDIRASFPDLSQISTTIETQHRRKDGSIYDVEVSISGTMVDGAPMVFTICRDITERKQHEAAILRANRALRTISAGNQALIHASDEGSLLQEMCKVAVEFGGYHMAWIGYARDDTDKSIEQMAQAGFEQGCPSLSQLNWHEGGQKACPAGDAIIQRKTRVVQDIQADSGADPWREHAQQYGYASCIALPLLDGDKAFGALVLFDDKVEVFDAAEVSLLEELAGDLAFGILTLRVKAAHSEHEQHLQRNMLKTVEAIASIVEMRDPYTSGHQRRVAELAEAIAKKMGMSEEEGLAIRLAGIVHDLGKIKIPAEILSKPGRLNEMEYNFIKMHPQAGYEILKEIDFSWPIAQMVHQHHERMDGSGYPLGIKGDEFLPGSRILAVADVMEAMSSHRPYRPGLGIEAALDELRNGRGNHFDAKVVDACTALFKEDGYELPQ